MTTTESFLADIEGFLAAKGVSATAFGKAAVNDPSLVADLRAGRSPSLAMVNKIYTYMAANRSPVISAPNASEAAE